MGGVIQIRVGIGWGSGASRAGGRPASGGWQPVCRRPPVWDGAGGSALGGARAGNHPLGSSHLAPRLVPAHAPALEPVLDDMPVPACTIRIRASDGTRKSRSGCRRRLRPRTTRDDRSLKRKTIRQSTHPSGVRSKALLGLSTQVFRRGRQSYPREPSRCGRQRIPLWGHR